MDIFIINSSVDVQLDSNFLVFEVRFVMNMVDKEISIIKQSSGLCPEVVYLSPMEATFLFFKESTYLISF